jgi:predicted Zn finger-like uncharacterized protein
MELICPSCEARYRVPDEAVGGAGRQVSCSNCGHGWHAVRPVAPGVRSPTPTPAPAASGAEASAPVQPVRPGQGQAGGAAAGAHEMRTSEPARLAQLAEIREMIQQVQSDERAPGRESREGRAAGAYAPRAQHAPIAAPAGAAGASGAPGGSGVARTTPGPRRVEDVGQDGEPLHQDPLRRRMAEHDARAARERDEREKLRRSMKYRKHEKKAGSGAFLSGFVLVVLVAGALLAAYLLHEEIALRVPESAPVLAEYVDAMDDLRSSIAEAYEQARAWVMDVIADAA